MTYIPFNYPPHTGNEDAHVLAAMKSSKISGDARYGLMCQEWFEKHRDVLAGDVDSLAAFYTEEAIFGPQEFQRSAIGGDELSHALPLGFAGW